LRKNLIISKRKEVNFLAVDILNRKENFFDLGRII
jgi:hypothetical protein